MGEAHERSRGSIVSERDEQRLGRRLQLARQAAGLTQQSLCQKANLSYSTLAKIERGAIRTPSVFTIQSIAAALGVSLDDLVGVPKPSEKQRQHSKSGLSFVYFDINGCLVRFYHQAFSQIAVDCDLAPDIVETTFWHYNGQICRGAMTMVEFNAKLARELGLPQFDWARYYFQAIKPMAHMRELVEWAHQHYGVGLLTNIMPGMIEQLHQQRVIPDVAYDAIVDSSVVHLLKPERAIYELAQSQAGCQPNETLLVDDSRTNLMAAEALGWHVLWFDDAHPEDSIKRVREALEPA